MASQSTLAQAMTHCSATTPSEFNLMALVADDTYDSLRKTFLSDGKGRPPNPPDVKLTNRLLLQLRALQTEGKRPAKNVEQWFKKLFPTVSFPTNRLRSLLDRGVKKLQSLTDEETASFLGTEIDLDFITFPLLKLGLKRPQLLEEEPFSLSPGMTATNEVVVDIESFRRKESLKPAFTVKWIKRLISCDKSITDSIVKKAVDQLMHMYQKINKSQSLYPGQLRTFLSLPFQFPQKPEPQCLSSPPEVASLKEVTSLEKMLAKEKKRNSILEEELKSLQKDNFILRDTINELSSDKKNMQAEIEDQRKLCSRVDRLKENVKEQQDTIRLLRTLPEVKQAQRRNRQLQAFKLSLRVLRAKVRTKPVLQRRLLKAREDVKTLQRKNESLTEILATKNRQLEDLHQELSTMDMDETELVTRGEKNSFNDSIRKAVMQLQGLCSVPARKCRQVIQIVAQTIFNKVIPDKDLPCLQTAINMADEGHVLAKLQATESMLSTENYTLHIDGTSRNGKKIVGHQVTLANGTTLSFGFTPVASEDSDSTLDGAVQLLSELSDLYVEGDENKPRIFQELLKGLTSQMTDRAAAMKKTGEKLQQFLESELGREVKLHCLHCNAHFLLGVSRACEQALESIETEIKGGEELGRDKQAKFKRFNSAETATSRIIRTSANAVGPNGDAKSGCRSEWIAYCEAQKRKSKMTSYRSNRFNNYFEGAAALLHHRNDLRLFFGSGCLGHSNLLIESVAADIEDDNLLALVCSLALLYLRITGPFWNLISSKTKYGDFHIYIQKMESCVDRWREDADDLLNQQFQGVFDGDFEMDLESDVPASVFQFAATNHAIIKSTLEMMMRDILLVIRRQLEDFLPGGKYGQPLTEEESEQVKHCPLTNLLGEKVFAEMDFEMGKKRHASLHHLSSIHMLNHNKTMEWLDGKSDAEARAVLKKARKKSRQLREQHRDQERVVLYKIREKQLENIRRKAEKEAETARKRAALIDRLVAHGGPCRTKEDVDSLFPKCRTSRGSLRKTQLIKMLKDQIRYQKQICGKKDLTLIGSVSDLAATAKRHLPGESHVLQEDELQECDEPRSKTQRLENENEENSDLSRTATPFSFATMRQWVAVYFDDKFYLGQVIDINSSTSATIQYLEQGKSVDSFQWPRRADIVKNTDASFVFYWDFELHPVSSSLRVWKVPAIDEISEAYERIKTQAQQ